ncbi:Eco57I restriction-modification methylase domain-containing protein, partial [Candidatus Bipolaricaulota bacterium]|nr:Eco57I restriction-modification methylase domain-containing protein [Candidatus Bipolaricaulota bacterium]
GPDFYEGKQMHLLDEEERYRINAFNWNTEFPEIMQAGGFDAVIGNPPWGAELPELETAYMNRFYRLQDYQLDSYLLFIEKSLNLMAEGGLFGMIIPNTWLLNLSWGRFRSVLFEEYQIESIVHHGRPVFPKATVNTEILVLAKALPAGDHKISIMIVNRDRSEFRHKITQRKWQQREGAPINVFERDEFSSLVGRMRKMPTLDELCVITQGAKPFQVGKGKPPQTRQIVTEKPYVSDTEQDDTFRPLLRGSMIQRYRISWNGQYWISLGDWLAEPRYSANYDAPEKIVIRQTGDSLVATLDEEQFVVRDNLYTVVPRVDRIDLRHVLGILNSQLLNWYYQWIINPERGEALAQVKRGHLAQLPIAVGDGSDLTELVEAMLKLHKQLAVVKTSHEKTMIQRQIDATDKQIDQLVYELYGLTDEEIRIVEGATN